VTRRLSCFFLGLVFLSVDVSGADDLLEMELSARADALQRMAHGLPASSPSSAPRPLLSAKAKGKLRIQWSVANGDKTGRLVDVTLHLVLDKPGSDPTYESALVVDLTAQTKTTGDVVVQAPQQAGDYRLRLETIGAAKTHGHEHVATIDVKVLP
jgi:hypothetical protein